ncbi:hypothetical protein, partial [Pseudoxanthomonas dokdonensis]|uniref:hypothetical protein n=1 Tax=Pseudoxanthomonas dokdonensis TaxID=344882 RepID=UPI001B7FF1CA
IYLVGLWCPLDSTKWASVAASDVYNRQFQAGLFIATRRGDGIISTPAAGTHGAAGPPPFPGFGWFKPGYSLLPAVATASFQRQRLRIRSTIAIL